MVEHFNELDIIHYMARPSHSELGKRVSALIERFFGGNRTAAARAWGVPQATVQRLVVGDSQTVRATTLDKIARKHDTSIDWLMSGRGPDPFATEPMPYVEYMDFERLVRGLQLSDAARRAVLDLPRATSHAHTILCHWGLMAPNPPPRQPDDVVGASMDARYKAAALQYVSWGYLFDGLIKAYGRERVREKLESEIQRTEMGFHPVPLEMLWLAEAKPLLATLNARFKERGRLSALLIDGPAIPPLDARLPNGPTRGRPAQFGTDRRRRP
ncbi:MAG: hypothetical protein ACRELE_09870 [Gemmatimonadales bacterium]